MVTYILLKYLHMSGTTVAETRFFPHSAGRVAVRMQEGCHCDFHFEALRQKSPSIDGTELGKFICI